MPRQLVANAVLKRGIVAFEQADDSFGGIGLEALELRIVAVGIAVVAGIEDRAFEDVGDAERGDFAAPADEDGRLVDRVARPLVGCEGDIRVGRYLDECAGVAHRRLERDSLDPTAVRLGGRFAAVGDDEGAVALGDAEPHILDTGEDIVPAIALERVLGLDQRTTERIMLRDRRLRGLADQRIEVGHQHHAGVGHACAALVVARAVGRIGGPCEQIGLGFG